MSLVDADTGEVIAQSTPDEARQQADPEPKQGAEVAAPAGGKRPARVTGTDDIDRLAVELRAEREMKQGDLFNDGDAA